MSNIIECKNLTHYYGNRCIYKDLNFTVEEGRVIGLFGKNGTGKTTLINILNGYLEPTSGYCKIFGENSSAISPSTKARIGLLLEGHIQHNYFNVIEIEQFYSRFFPHWRKQVYYDLLEKLRISLSQKISTMSCGQRSQIALGLLLAQNPDLLILDDFSMGLDPGYRRLFIELLKDYIAREHKTVFLTSHIIQDMEKIIDECVILDYGKILIQCPTDNILKNFKRFSFVSKANSIEADNDLWNIDRIGDQWETYSFLSNDEVRDKLSRNGEISQFKSENISLEDAFIGLTGKY